MTTTPYSDLQTLDRHLVCPACSESLEDLPCPTCGGGSYRHGIPSFGGTVDDECSRWLSQHTLEELALAVEQKPIRPAIMDCLAGHQARSSVLDACFAVRRDAWRFLVGGGLTGRCLEVGARFGRRSEQLSEAVETVYAVDHSLAHLRIAAERTRPREGVIPVNATVDQLPFAAGSMDTVVADLDRLAGDPARHLDILSSMVADGGTMYVLASGWTRSSGLAARFGLERNADRRGHSAWWYRRRCGSMGFESVDVYGLLPTADRPLYCFNTNDRAAVAELGQFLRGDTGLLATLTARGLRSLDRFGILEQCLPSYLIVCGDTGTGPVEDIVEPLQVLGRARSVILEPDGRRVYKIPNCRRNERLTRREHRIVSDLRTRSELAAECLPAGSLHESRIGPVRVESRLSGKSLSERLSKLPVDAGTVVETGLEWLARFQHSMSLERTHRKPDDIERELSFEPADITGFRPSEPLETVITPIHGDYLPANLLISDDQVTGVIDWEYGALEGSPAVDAGLLVLDVVNQVAGGLAPGLNRLVDGGPLADQVGRPLATYCDTLEIPSRSLVTDLPLAYVHRLELDWQVGTTSTASSRVERRARAVELVAERRPDLERWLESYR